MALRNAFEKLLTETVAGAVEAAIVRMDARQARQALMEQPRVLQYARTATDQLRVNVDNAPQAIVYVGQSSTAISAGINRSPYGDANAIFMVDERWQQAEQSMQTFNFVRNQRWKFS
jgi:hypothetical protein